MRSAPPLRPSVRKTSHQRITASISAIELSLATIFGIKKNIVVQACRSHLPHFCTLSKSSTTSPLVYFSGAAPPHILRTAPRLWCSKYPQKQTQDLSWEVEVRRPGPNHREADSLKSRRSTTNATAPKSSSPARYLNLSPKLFVELHFGHQKRPTQFDTFAATPSPQKPTLLPTNVSTLTSAQSASHS